MSQTNCYIILHHSDPKAIDELRPLFANLEGEVPEFGGYSVETATLFEHTLIAQIVGTATLDTQGLIDALRKPSPDWLYLRCDYDQVGEKETLCEKRGKKTTKATLMKNVRAASKQVDLYFAVAKAERERIDSLLQDPAIDLSLVLDGIPLLIALMRLDSKGLFRRAIKRGADINVRIEHTQWLDLIHAVKGMNLLSIAIQMNAKAMVDFLIEAGCDVNAVDARGNAPINIAAERRERYDMLWPLIAAGADINHPSGIGFPPLFAILAERHTPTEEIMAVAERMMALGANIHHVCNNGMNALWIARGVNPLLAEFVRGQGITECRIPDDFYDGYTGYWRLMRAMEWNDIETFRNSLNLHELDRKEQQSLLFDAAAKQQIEWIEAVLESGVPVYLRSREKLHAHDCAATPEIRAYLLDKMADFGQEAQRRVEQVRPLFDRLMSAIEATDWISLDRFEEFSAHDYFRSMSQNELLSRLKSWAEHLHKQTLLDWDVDDEFNVTFIRSAKPIRQPHSPVSCTVVKIEDQYLRGYGHC